MASSDNVIEPPAWLWRELTRREWTQQDLARRSGISVGHISRLMSGEREFGMEAYTAIAPALRMSLEDLFRLAGVLPPEPDGEGVAALLATLGKLPKDEQGRLLAEFQAAADRALDGESGP